MKRILAVLLSVSVLFVTSGVRAAEREAPPSAHFVLSGMLAVLAVVHYDRSVKYQERANEAFASGSQKAEGYKSTADRMRFRSKLFTAAAGVFLVTGGIRLVLDDGLVGVRKEVRF